MCGLATHLCSYDTACRVAGPPNEVAQGSTRHPTRISPSAQDSQNLLALCFLLLHWPKQDTMAKLTVTVEGPYLYKVQILRGVFK